jgi:phosphate transport system substrate-binding protein
LCSKNGVTNITEAIVGFDGIAFAQSKKNKAQMKLTKKQLLLAVAAKVPSKDGKSLIDNPYTKWNQIDASLPNKQIVIYGPPTSSGTRDAFEDMILKAQTKKMEVYKKAGFKKYHKIREDGAFIPAGENDNLIVQKLDKDTRAFGIFGYSFLIENEDKVKGSLINGVAATPENISSGKYPISRSLYFYVKNDHRKQTKGMEKYISLFMSENMIGPDGVLGEIGLIALPDDLRKETMKNVINGKKLTKKDLSKK